jgi:hypothetical protein
LKHRLNFFLIFNKPEPACGPVYFLFGTLVGGRARVVLEGLELGYMGIRLGGALGNLSKGPLGSNGSPQLD